MAGRLATIHPLSPHYFTYRKPPIPSFSSIPIRHAPIKRIFDITFSFFALILTAPIIAIAALLIRLTSKGAALYSHPRVGRGGKIFKCYKLRSMYCNADERLQAILSTDPICKKEWNEKQKLSNDPRVTPIGRFLRKTSIDELPQFWNVLIGDLSIVGPRPVVQQEVQKFLRHRAPTILSMRPGLTCTWQVSGRSDTTRSRRIAMDMHYVKHQSLALDIALIARTIPAILGSRGAC